MAKSIARDAEDFARLLFQTVERLGANGEWVPARAAFAETVACHPEHPYAVYLAAKPARRIGLAAVAERLRAAEFATIERRKAGSRRNAPVFYRVVRATVALDLQLPLDVPADHPLVKQHRATSAAAGQPVSARRTLMTEPGPKSPWRRRLLPRPIVIHVPNGLEAASHSVRQWWERVRIAVAGITASTRRS
jgi:predicted Zn-dependent protease